MIPTQIVYAKSSDCKKVFSVIIDRSNNSDNFLKIDMPNIKSLTSINISVSIAICKYLNLDPLRYYVFTLLDHVGCHNISIDIVDLDNFDKLNDQSKLNYINRISDKCCKNDFNNYSAEPSKGPTDFYQQHDRETGRFIVIFLTKKRYSDNDEPYFEVIINGTYITLSNAINNVNLLVEKIANIDMLRGHHIKIKKKGIVHIKVRNTRKSIGK